MENKIKNIIIDKTEKRELKWKYFSEEKDIFQATNRDLIITLKEDPDSTAILLMFDLKDKTYIDTIRLSSKDEIINIVIDQIKNQELDERKENLQFIINSLNN